MTALVLRGDARSLPLPDASVDLVVTSPPYYALRSYTDGGQHYDGQIGSEATPQEYIRSLVDCTREWVRVLKPSGSIFVNLGDKYVNPSVPGARDSLPAGGRPGQLPMPGHRSGKQARRVKAPSGGMPSKSLMFLPERYRIACVDQLGLIARAVVVWSKPNGLPESVQDRVRRSHEDWVHLTVQPRYFSAVDEIRETYAPGTAARYAAGYNPRKVDAHRPSVNTKLGGDTYDENPLGKLPGSVWEIPTEPLKVPAHLGVDHFAAFPTEWPRRIILGWSPSGICTVCGEGRRPVADRSEKALHRPSGAERVGSRMAAVSHSERERTNCGNVRTVHRIVGEACACPDAAASTRPGVVLDPFGGTGTTALVARALGRTGITVDLSADYCRLAQWRTTDPGELARALRVPKPPVEVESQLALFGEAAS